MANIAQEESLDSSEEIEVLESYVLDRRVHAIIDNPTEEVIPEG